jgi:PKD repeat protein
MYVNSYAGNTNGKNTLALVADFTATVTTGCAPLSTTFTSTSTSDVGDPIVSYSWNFGDGSPVSTAVSPTHTYNIQNNFTVSLTVTTQGGSTKSVSKTNYISSYAKPVFNLGNDTIVCEGTELTLKTASGYDTYTWSDPINNTFPNAFFSPDPGVNIIWAEVGNGTCSVRDSIQVTVNSMLTAKWGYRILSNCGDVQVEFLDSSSSCDPANNIMLAWIIDGADIYTEPAPVHTFLTGGPHDVQHFAQDDNGNVTDTTITIMLPDPVAGPSSIVLRDTTICAGNSVQLDAGNEPGATYVWSPATGLSNTSIHNPVATPSSTQTYTVTETKCGIDSTANITVTVSSALTVNLGPDVDFCTGSFITLDAGNAGATYKWGSTYNPSYYGSRTTQTINATGAGTYWVTVMHNGCTATDTVVLVPKKAIAAAFNYTPSGSGSCGPFSVDVTENAVLCTGSVASHNWNFGDGTIITGYNQTYTHTYSVPGTYTIRLIATSTGGVNDTVSHNVTYTGSVLSVNLGNDTTICAGNSVIMNAGNAGSTYLWSNGATTQSITVSPSSTTTYSVTVTGSGGCSGTDSKTVTVSGLPVVNLGNDTTICVGSGLTIDAGNAGSTYLWSTGATTQSITVSPSSTTTYSVTVTSGGGCTGTDSKTVTVSGLPVVNLGNDTTICVGSGLTIDAGNAGSTYLWSNGATTQSIIVGPMSTTTYSVTVTNAGGCSASDSKVVNIGLAPSVNLGNDTTVCAGNSVTINAGNAGSTYLWSNGAITQSISVTPSSTTTYSVTVTSSGGCTGTDSKTVTIGASLSVNLGNDTTVCAGNSVTINAGNAGSTYLWSNGATTQSITVSPSSTTTYSVTVTSSGGCTGTDSKTVTVGSGLSVNLGNDTTICVGNSITLDAGNAGSTYLWSDGATTQSISVTPSSTTTYSVTVTSSGGCTGTDSKDVTVNPALVVNLGPDQGLCPGAFMTLDAGNAGATYKWGSTYMSSYYGSRTTQTVNATGAGTYWVTVKKNGCTARDTIILAPKTAITAEFTSTQSGSGSCGPYSVNVTENSAVCTGSVADHVWDFGDGTVISGYNQTYNHNYTTAGVHTITLIVTTSGGSKDTIQHDVTFAGSSFAVNLGKDTAICSGSSLTLDAGNAGSTYLWKNGETSQAITVTAAGTYYVQVNNGICIAVDTINVAVSSQLNVNLGNDTTICAGNSVTLDAGNAGATYLWSSNAASATTQSVSVTPVSGINTYTVTVSNGACTGQGSIKITVSTSLPVNLGADTAICAGSSITLDAGYPGALYTWTDAVTSQTRIVTTAGTYKVSVDKSGCTGEDEINITLMNPPAAVNLGNDINVCFGNSIELDAGDHAPSAYLWSTGATTQKINVTGSGTYNVSITGCGITVRDTINVTMGNLPMPGITQSGLELISSDADSYQWYKDGNFIPGATGKKYKPRGYGNYSVEISNTAMGCSGKSADYWFVPSGQVYLGDVRVKVTPNPSNGFTKLVLSKVPVKPIMVTVYDAIGRRIISTTAINTVTDLNLMPFAKGLYFVECISGDQKVILPLITQ